MGRAAGPRDLDLDLAPGAEARIEQPRCVEPAERRAVIVEMLGLATDRPVPIEAEPAQILDDGIRVFRAAAGMVDILDAQQETPAGLARRSPSLQRRADMPEMQIAGRARRKPGDDSVGAHVADPRRHW